ncbi:MULTISPECIES: helix-turn-helix domain-containing protein [Streptomyces]|uniref:helix-turn-helix domain-containing protein n=1 Tax=Streptomyces TaxID=1883 RepID=UPI001674CB70
MAEARRVRAAELFERGRSHAEIARMPGVSAESVRRWKRALPSARAGGAAHNSLAAQDMAVVGQPAR